MSLTFFGCEEFDLDEDPGQAQLAVLPYENIAELDLAVTGMYNRVHRAPMDDDLFCLCLGREMISLHIEPVIKRTFASTISDQLLRVMRAWLAHGMAAIMQFVLQIPS